jgi:hypothetical protein
VVNLALENQTDFQTSHEIPHEKWFFFAHGRKAKDIEGLKKVLEKIDDIEFNHHVNDQRNDFANWVEGVFGEEELASKLRKAYNKEDMHDVVDEFLKEKQPQEEPVTAQPITPAPAPRQHRARAKQETQAPLEQEKTLPAFEEHDYLSFDDKTAPKIEDAPKKKDFEEKKEQREEYPELPIIKPIDDLDEPLPFEKGEEGKEKLVADEKDLSDKDLKKIVLNAKQALADEERDRHIILKHESDWHHRFVVKEFIYGFVLGLIFGMMMLGIIVNLGA